MKISIIAVTGLGGRGFSSWAHSGGEMWLRDYLPTDIPGIRVLIYGYPSKLEKSSSRARLMDYTIQFLQILDSARCLPKVRKKISTFHRQRLLKMDFRTKTDLSYLLGIALGA
jgi:hypothetical protein